MVDTLCSVMFLYVYIVQVCGYLNSKSWETRVAAGQAVEAIAKNVKKWQPPKIESDSSDGKESPPPDKEDDLMSFNTFDIKQVSILARSYLSSHAHIQVQSPSHTHTPPHTHTHPHTHTGVDSWDYTPFVYWGGVSLS